MLRIQRVSILLFVSLFCVTIVRSQRVAVRNNLMYDAALSPNFGMELRLDSTWTVGMNVGFNLWDYNKAKNQKWRHIMVSPNLRHYNKEMFRKSFWGIHAVYSHYNVGNVKFPFGLYKEVRDKRRQGDLVAIGGSWGYNWWLTGRLHIEAEIGMALGYTWYKEYECGTCGTYLGKYCQLIPLPKLGINLVWSNKPKCHQRRKAVDAQLGEMPVPPYIPIVHKVADRIDAAGEPVTAASDRKSARAAAVTINKAVDLLQSGCEEDYPKALHKLEGVSSDPRAQNALGAAQYLCGREQEALDTFRRAADNGDQDAAKNLKEIEKRR